MIYLRKFSNHRDYSDIMNNGGLQLELPSVSYCDDVDDVHFNQYNMIRFFAGNLETPETIEVYLNKDKSEKRTVELLVRDKWYYIYLPSDKALYGTNDYSSVTKAYFSVNVNNIPWGAEKGMISINSKEVSFKGSNTSNVTDMSFMFNGCTTLTSLDVSSFDTSNVTNMTSMFSQCPINSIDVSNFDTSKVTNMSDMFSLCANLTSLTLSNFDTSNVTDMIGMFGNCSGLISLDLSNFNTSNVTDMSSMFDGCTSLSSLDLSGWDTSKVTDMNGMFYVCANLTSLDLSSFDTSKVTNMNYMFGGCTSLTSLDLSGWNTSKVDYTTDMFKGCTSLKTIKMVGCTPETINKIKAQLETDRITGVTITT